ncbi:hypothetical protein [Pantoea sp. 18069]|uniref:hypothetical protein n=1 Tax=Pantoea sp. 18069 TaxID=2681415 RepID=UPI0013583E12|nr:hypothetical protein [Pantoea sp. 18069]
MRETLFYRLNGVEALYGLRRDADFKSTRVMLAITGRRGLQAQAGGKPPQPNEQR